MLNELIKVLVENFLQTDIVERSEMAMLRYRKTLDIVERFMIDSRIREYCTDICKGDCCAGCYKNNKEACHRHEKRRLSCSIYLCLDFYKRISREDHRTLSNVKSVILKECRNFTYDNIYFKIPSKEFFRKSRFPSEVICELNEDVVKRINIIMTELINNNIDIKSHRGYKKYHPVSVHGLTG